MSDYVCKLGHAKYSKLYNTAVIIKEFVVSNYVCKLGHAKYSIL